MTLPATPPITLAQVRAEFGAPATATLDQFLRGGAYVPDIPANAGVPAALPITLLDLLGASDTPPINVTNHTINGLEWDEPNPFPPPAVIWNAGDAVITVRSDGVLRGTWTLGTGASDSTDYAGEWLVAGSAAAYDVRATVISGTVDGGSGSIGVWHNCGAGHWSWSKIYAGAGGQTCVVRLEFRAAGDATETILDSFDATLTVSRS